MMSSTLWPPRRPYALQYDRRHLRHGNSVARSGPLQWCVAVVSGLHGPRCATGGGHRPLGRAPPTTPVQKWYRLDVVADSFELVLLDPPPVPTRRTFGHRDTVPAIPLLLPPSDNWRGKDKGWEREYREMHRPSAQCPFCVARCVSRWVVNSGQRVCKMHFRGGIRLLLEIV
jgi:hypothetical protein